MKERSPYHLSLKEKVRLLNRWRERDSKLSEFDKRAVWYILYTASRKAVCKQFGYLSNNPKVKPIADEAVLILADLLLNKFHDKGVSYSFFVFRVAFSTLLAEHQLASCFNYPDNVSKALVVKRFIWYTKKCRVMNWNYANPDIDTLVSLHLTETYQQERNRKKTKDEVRSNFNEFREFYSVNSLVDLNVSKA